MGLEVLICECGQEYETSEWVVSRACPDCAPPPRRSISELDRILAGMDNHLNQLRQNTRIGDTIRVQMPTYTPDPAPYNQQVTFNPINHTYYMTVDDRTAATYTGIWDDLEPLLEYTPAEPHPDNQIVQENNGR